MLSIEVEARKVGLLQQLERAMNLSKAQGGHIMRTLHHHGVVQLTQTLDSKITPDIPRTDPQTLSPQQHIINIYLQQRDTGSEIQ